MAGGAKQDQKQEPAIAGLEISTSIYGRPVALIYGRVRCSGNLIWIGTLLHTAINSTDGIVAFFDFGGPAISSTTYEYYISAMMGVCEGPIRTILNVWREKEYRSILGPGGSESLPNEVGEILPRAEYPWYYPPDKRLHTRAYAGYPNQPPFDLIAEFGTNIVTLIAGKQGSVPNEDSITEPHWVFVGSPTYKKVPWLETPNPSLNYPYLAYFARALWPLKSRASFPQLNFEVIGLVPFLGYVDQYGLSFGSDPSEIIRDILTNPIHGIDFPAEHLGDLRPMSRYCTAARFLMSAKYEEAESASQSIDTLTYLSNTIPVWSQGRLKFIPQGDEELTNEIDPLYRYFPTNYVLDAKGALTLQAAYNLTPDDFIYEEGDDPLKLTRTSVSELKNVYSLTYPQRYASRFLRFKQAFGDVAAGQTSMRMIDIGPEWASGPPARGEVFRLHAPTPSSIYYQVTKTQSDGSIQFYPPAPTGGWGAGQVFVFEAFEPRYEDITTEAKDQTSIEQFGYRRAEDVTAGLLTDEETVQRIGSILVGRTAWPRMEARFRLPWRFVLLEPGDIVLLTCSVSCINRVPFQILSIEEDGEGTLHIEAIEYITGQGTAVLYNQQLPTPILPQTDVDPGKVRTFVVLEPTADLTEGNLQLWVAIASGSKYWGGAHIWVSEEGEEAYFYAGTIRTPARIGSLRATLAMGGTLVTLPDGRRRWEDATNTVDVEMLENLTNDEGVDEVLSVSLLDAQDYKSAVYIGGGDDAIIPYEVISYVDATLQPGESRRYTLDSLYRKAFNTVEQNHAVNAQVLFLDPSRILRLSIPERLIGRRLRVKALSYNIYGTKQQQLDDPDISTTSIVITGLFYSAPLDTVPFLQFVFDQPSGNFRLFWGEVTDFRPVSYEIRRGDDWFSAVCIQRTNTTSIPILGDGTYWVAPFTGSPTSAARPLVFGSPQSIVVVGTEDFVENILVSHDEVTPSLFSDYQSLVVQDTPSLWLRMDDSVPPRAPVLHDSLDAAFTGAYSAGGVSFLSDLNYQSGFFAPRFDGLAGLATFTDDGRLRQDQDNWSWLGWFQLSTGLHPTTFTTLLVRDGQYCHIGLTPQRLIGFKTSLGTLYTASHTPVSIGSWNFLAVVYRASTQSLTIYLNGSPVLNATSVVLSGAGPGVDITFAGGGTSTVPFAGALSDWAFLPKALAGVAIRILWTRANAAVSDWEGYYERVLAYRPSLYIKFDEAGELQLPNHPYHGFYSSNVFGSWVGATALPNFVSGLVASDTNKAVALNAQNGDVINVPQLYTLVPPYTVVLECLVRPQGSFPMAVMQFANDAGSSLGPSIIIEAGGSVRADFVDSGQVSHVIVSAPGLIVAGQVYYLCVVYSQHLQELHLYINQNRVQTVLAGIFVPNVAQPGMPDFRLRVGELRNSLGTVTRRYTGTIDEVAFYAPLNIDSAAKVEELETRIFSKAISALYGTQLPNDLVVVMPEGYLRTTDGSGGYWEIPSSHWVTLSSVQTVLVSATWKARGLGAENFDDVLIVDETSLIDTQPLKFERSQGYGRMIEAWPEVAFRNSESASWSTWVRLVPGHYHGKQFKVRFWLKSLRSGIRAQLERFQWHVDVPDIIQHGTFVTTTISTDTLVTFSTPYSPLAPLPEITWSVLNEPPGTIITLVEVSSFSFTFRLSDATGQPVEGLTVNWIAQGY